MPARLVKALIARTDGTAEVRLIPGELSAMREVLGAATHLGALWPLCDRILHTTSLVRGRYVPSGEIADDWHAYVDVQALLKRLDPNPYATHIARTTGWDGRGWVLRGTVIFLGVSGERGPVVRAESDVPGQVLYRARVLYEALGRGLDHPEGTL